MVNIPKITVATLAEMKRASEKIAMLTCYDYTMSRILDGCGTDVLLVGDSLGMVVLGYENTIPVTLEEVLHHAKAVRRGCRRGLLVADLPFLSYELDPKEAARNAGRLVKEAGVEGVKVEGGLEVASSVKEIVRINVPVMGHLGLTPQSIHRLGGYRVQGKTPQSAEKILTDAKVLEGSGVFAIVLECIPSGLAEEITRKVSVPTIGIGAGPHCDGQVLVLDDLLGLYGEHLPKYVKQYADLKSEVSKAVGGYLQEVRQGRFPSPEFEYG